MSSTIVYTPPATIKSFIRHYLPNELFYNWVVGPVGSGKTTGLFFKLVYMAKLQEPSPDGIRRTKAVIVRNTASQLRDTTLASWNYWFKDGVAGTWRATDSKFTLRFDDVECEVLFRPLDTPDDIERVLSLEVTFAIIDEFVNVPISIIDALSSRVGRYKMPDGVAVTNYGVWGSSNPSTEDNQWYPYLHENLPDNATYFHQPSGFSDQAENLDNLPGGRKYYENQAKGKSPAWVKQYIDAEWGFSAEGKPVIDTFNADLHVAKLSLNYDPAADLILGFDPGLAGSAFVFGQEDLHGRLKVYGELVQSGYGVTRLISERLKPYLRRRFPGAHVVISPDPAAALRAQLNEKTVIDELKRHFDVKYEPNNRLPKRLNAIEKYTTRLTDVGPALLIDPHECPILVRALKGGWKFEINPKTDSIKSPEPLKNHPYSDTGDAFGYLARYYDYLGERAERRSRGNMPAAARQPTNTYHFR